MTSADNSYLQRLELRAERVATVRGVTIHGLTVWRSGNGHLRVPSRSIGHGYFSEIVEPPPEAREQAELEVLAAYKASRGEAKR